MDTKHNVYIIETASGKAVSLVGENLPERKVETRIMTALGRIDRDNYFVADAEVGSEYDLKLAESLKVAA